MVDNNDGLLREVEEELRRERLEKIWRQYGTYIIAAAALVVIGVGGYKYIETRRVAAAQAAGAQYEAALSLLTDKKNDEAAQAFRELVANAPRGYQTLARLQLAGVLVQQGRKADARDAYDALANDTSADPMLREFASLQSAALRLGESDWTEIQNRLMRLTDDDSPWRYNARELLGLAAFKAGKTEEASNILTPLMVDQKTPQGVVERAQIVLAEIIAQKRAKETGSGTPSSNAAGSHPVVETPAGAKKE